MSYTNTLAGTNGNDTIVGLPGSNQIFGAGGSDTIFGGDQDDYLVGDAGPGLSFVKVKVTGDAFDAANGEFPILGLYIGGVLVDQKPITASRSGGQLQDVVFATQIPVGTTDIQVRMLNDKFQAAGGGQPKKDNNLFIKEISVNDVVLNNATSFLTPSNPALPAKNTFNNGFVNMTGSGFVTFALPPLALAPSIAGDDFIVGMGGNDYVSGNGGNDILLGDNNFLKIDVTVAADLWDTVKLPSPNGAPRFRVLVDGVQIGDENTVTAVNRNGETQTFSFTASNLTNGKKVTVEYLNDVAGLGLGDVAPVAPNRADRNLFVKNVVVNGVSQDIPGAFYDLDQVYNDAGLADRPNTDVTSRSGSGALPWGGKLDFTLDQAQFAKGNDVILGGSGSDVLIGGLDNGTLALTPTQTNIVSEVNGFMVNSGPGATVAITGGDRLTGGTGVDVFTYGLNDGVDTISDFENDTDKLNLVGLNAGSFILVDIMGGDALVVRGGGVGILVKGISAANLADDIVLTSVA